MHNPLFLLYIKHETHPVDRITPRRQTPKQDGPSIEVMTRTEPLLHGRGVVHLEANHNY